MAEPGKNTGVIQGGVLAPMGSTVKHTGTILGVVCICARTWAEREWCGKHSLCKRGRCVVELCMERRSQEGGIGTLLKG